LILNAISVFVAI